MSDWQFIGAYLDGEAFALEGTDVWKSTWLRREGEFAEVRDPHHHQRFRFEVFELPTAAGRVVFAAGEFSNGVWGFYRPADAKT